MKRAVLHAFGKAQRPAAWILLAGGAITFLVVLFDLVATGTAKWATLLIAADLTVSGFTATQETENDIGGQGSADTHNE